jgi:hypothetical protein
VRLLKFDANLTHQKLKIDLTANDATVKKMSPYFQQETQIVQQTTSLNTVETVESTSTDQVSWTILYKNHAYLAPVLNEFHDEFIKPADARFESEVFIFGFRK